MGRSLYTRWRDDTAYHRTDFAVACHPFLCRSTVDSHIMVVCRMVYRPDTAISLSDARTGIVRCIARHQSIDDAIRHGRRCRNRRDFCRKISLASITWFGALEVTIAIVVVLVTFSSHANQRASNLKEINQ